MPSSESTGSDAFFKITTAGDLEIATLVENQEAFPDVLSLDLYKVLGQAPDQHVMFHNEQCFDMFIVQVAEMFAESANNAEIDGLRMNLSLFSAAKWLCERHPDQTQAVGLKAAIDKLEAWMDEEVEFNFWCPELGITFELKLSRRRIISFAGNLTKHNLLRINKLLGDLRKLLKKNGYEVDGTDIISVLGPFKYHYRAHLNSHATYLVEMLYEYFSSINRLLEERFKENGSTNDFRKMKFPDGSSAAYQNLYVGALVFAHGSQHSFHDRKAVASPPLKSSYG